MKIVNQKRASRYVPTNIENGTTSIIVKNNLCPIPEGIATKVYWSTSDNIFKNTIPLGVDTFIVDHQVDIGINNMPSTIKTLVLLNNFINVDNTLIGNIKNLYIHENNKQFWKGRCQILKMLGIKLHLVRTDMKMISYPCLDPKSELSKYFAISNVHMLPEEEFGMVMIVSDLVPIENIAGPVLSPFSIFKCTKEEYNTLDDHQGEKFISISKISDKLYPGSIESGVETVHYDSNIDIDKGVMPCTVKTLIITNSINLNTDNTPHNIETLVLDSDCELDDGLVKKLKNIYANALITEIIYNKYGSLMNECGVNFWTFLWGNKFEPVIPSSISHSHGLTEPIILPPELFGRQMLTAKIMPLDKIPPPTNYYDYHNLEKQTKSDVLKRFHDIIQSMIFYCDGQATESTRFHKDDFTAAVIKDAILMLNNIDGLTISGPVLNGKCWDVEITLNR